MKIFLRNFTLISLCQLVPTFIFMLMFQRIKIVDLTLLQFGLFLLFSSLSAKYLMKNEVALRHDMRQLRSSVATTADRLATHFSSFFKEVAARDVLIHDLSQVSDHSAFDRHSARVQDLLKEIETKSAALAKSVDSRTKEQAHETNEFIDLVQALNALFGLLVNESMDLFSHVEAVKRSIESHISSLNDLENGQSLDLESLQTSLRDLKDQMQQVS